VKRAVLSVVVLAVALVLQLTVVNRLPLPGAGAPDLVLLAVVALSLAARPATAAVTGFAAGLCLDIAPPGSYLVGEYALVFCLVGYFCARLRGPLNNLVLPTIAAAMAAAAAGEGLIALLGRAVSDPQVTWAAVRQVLPSSIIYDVAVTPFLLYLVMRAVRWTDGLWAAAGADGRQADGAELLARSLGGSATRLGGALPGATALGGAGLLGGAGWLAGPVPSRGSRGGRSRRGVHVPRTPRLREAAARSGDGWVGGGPRARLRASAGLGTGRPAVARRGRPPRLRPGAGTPGSALARPSRTLPRTTVNLRMGAGRRGDGNLVRALGMGAAGLAGGTVRSRAGSGPPGSAFRGRRPAGGGPAAGRAGAPARRPSGSGPKFRPETRLPGGSSSGAAFRAAAPRALPSRKVNLRLGGTRRHDGVVGGSVLRGSGSALRASALRGGGSGLRTNANGLRGNGSGLRGSALRGSGSMLRGSGSALRGGGNALRSSGNGLRSSAFAGSGHRAGGIRPVSLRLGSGRRGDGVVGGLSGGQARLGGQRRAAPRFRSGPAIGGHSVLGKRHRPRLGKQARFGAGRRSFLAAWTGGRLGSRSTVWRIGSKRTGGF
jgi:rod shape-determining protein MreD